ncbi:MAG: hypothetical protein PQJ61_08515 [Spirochaetales bacterium]|uniref:Secreted protein n=1 Tax=Candidatus Thalassospirochaeta sargassi TaxID=3119039 RepID=A0AAJ1ICL5_9SPIO|nr:hypothetical protein [Spirochaetales bacterium]
MFKKCSLFLILLILAVANVSADDSRLERPWDFSLELNQMLHIQLDVEYFFNDSIGMKAGFGVSPLGWTCFTYNVLVVYHLNLPEEHFQLDFEAGLPIAYFDFIEGRYVDWDPMIDDPYYGFLPGACLLISYRFNEEHALGLRAGVAAMFEHNLDSGWKEPGVMPVFAIVYNF